MLEEESSCYETIEEIKSIKKKRANTDLTDVFLCLGADAFYIVRESARRGGSLHELITRKDYLDKIAYSEITDILFPSFKNVEKKIKDKARGFPFKILTAAEEYWIWVSEAYFWISRKLFEDTMFIKENVR